MKCSECGRGIRLGEETKDTRGTSIRGLKSPIPIILCPQCAASRAWTYRFVTWFALGLFWFLLVLWILFS